MPVFCKMLWLHLPNHRSQKGLRGWRRSAQPLWLSAHMHAFSETHVCDSRQAGWIVGWREHEDWKLGHQRMFSRTDLPRSHWQQCQDVPHSGHLKWHLWEFPRWLVADWVQCKHHYKPQLEDWLLDLWFRYVLWMGSHLLDRIGHAPQRTWHHIKGVTLHRRLYSHPRPGSKWGQAVKAKFWNWSSGQADCRG